MLAYTESGIGDPLIFLPGITCSSEHWRPVSDLLESAYRCVLLDPPGHGRSHPGPMEPLQQASAIREVVEHLGIQRPLMIGHSAGGIAAIVYALVYPSRGVVGIEGTLDLTGPFAQDVYRLRELLADPERFEEGFDLVTAPMRIDLVPEERRAWAESLIGKQREVVLDSWRHLLAGKGSALNDRLRQLLPSLAVPLLMLWGDEVPKGERQMLSLIPDVSIEMWPGLGHFIHLVDPQRIARRIDTFATGLGRSEESD